MTGAYVRIQRDGKWDNIEIDQLTDDELDAFIVTRNMANDLPRWVKFLAGWIRDNIKEEATP